MPAWDGTPRRKWTDADAESAVAMLNQTMQALRYEADVRASVEPGSDAEAFLAALDSLRERVIRLQEIEQRAKEVGENEFLFYDTQDADMVASYILTGEA